MNIMRFMIIILSLGWVTVQASHLVPLYQQTKGSYIGAIRFPLSVTSPPRLTGYYKGTRLDVNNAQFEVKEYKSVPGFYFLFTLDSITPYTDANDPNTIRSLQLEKESSYKCFKILRTRCDKLWHIEEVTLPNTSSKMCEIPETTIILPVDPSLIEGLSLDFERSAHATPLPNIVFKKDISKNRIHEMALLATFAALDLNPFHRKPTTIQAIKRDTPNIIMSLVTE